MTDAPALFRLASYGHDLLTRDRAATIRADLRRALDALVPGTRLTVDLSDVGAITPSFADELLGRLLLEIGEQRFRSDVRLRTTDETVRLLVNRVLAHRASESRTAGNR
jgi:hypothetical protein